MNKSTARNEEEVERLKEQSRQLAFDNYEPLPLPLEKLENILKRFPPNFKSYSYLKFLNFLFGGTGIVLLFLSIGIVSTGYKEDVLVVAVIIFIFLFPLGCICLALIPILVLMRDLQENADRQSILLTMLYDLMSKKAKK